MGLLVEGRWLDQWYDTESTKGRFERSAAQFRNWVTADGRAGPTGAGGFKAEPGRYHLYVSLACPWAHRTLIFRKLKGLESLATFSVTSRLQSSLSIYFCLLEGNPFTADNAANVNRQSTSEQKREIRQL